MKPKRGRLDFSSAVHIPASWDWSWARNPKGCAFVRSFLSRRFTSRRPQRIQGVEPKDNHAVRLTLAPVDAAS